MYMERAIIRAYDDEAEWCAWFGPRTDGFKPIFYQKCWEIVSGDFLSIVKKKKAFTTASLEESLNHTFIVLIPKVSALQFFGQFRPISLCNVAYKVKTKVIANRLRKIMPNYTPPNRPPSFMLHHCISMMILDKNF